MSVYKRPGQTVYSYDFRCRGARFSGTTNCTTKREAERYEQEMRAQAKAATVDRSRPMTFAVASSLYWDEKGQFLANSLDLERYLAWLQKHVGKATLVSAISDSDIASLVARRRGELAVRGKGERVSNATVNRSVTQPMRAILRRCAKTWKQAVQDIEWKDHFLKEPQERVREATPDEEARLLAAIRPDYRPVVRFAILTGCRMSEILTLEWARVNFFNDTFTVIGKGDRQRSIPMVKEVRDLLWDLKDHHAEMVFTFQATKTRDGHLRGKRYPITENGFKTQWRRVKRDSGVSNFRFHDTRHTAATRLVRKTGNLKMAQKLLGHTELATTARYSHVTDADLRAGLEAVSATAPSDRSPDAVENENAGS